MTFRWGFGIAILLAAICCGATVAHAAQVSSVRDHQKCALRLEGEIKAGDFSKFLFEANEQKLIDGDWTTHNDINSALCLDSPGGSWSEARFIAGMVFKEGITTRIEAGASCGSACALIFMAGRTLGLERNGPSHYLHVTGRLGFHAPWLVLPPNKTYTAKDMQDISILQNELIGEFIRFGTQSDWNSSRPTVAMSLIADMLSTGPNDMTYVETIEQAARWNISLEGTPKNYRLSEAAIIRACQNALAWPHDRKTPKSSASHTVEIIESEEWGTAVRVFVEQMAPSLCMFELPKGTKSIDGISVEYLAVCTQDGINGVGLGDCPDYRLFAEGWYTLKPETKLTDLAN